MPPVPIAEDPFYIILPSWPGFFQLVSFPRFPHQNPVCNFPQSQTSHMPRPSQSCLFVHPHLIWRGVQIIKFFIMCLLQSPVTSSYLDTNIFLSTLFSNILSLCSSLNISVQVSHPYKILLLLLLLLLSSLLYHNKCDVRSSAQNNLPDAIHNSLSACFIDFLTRETVNFVTCSDGLTSDKVNFTCTFVTIMNTLSGLEKEERITFINYMSTARMQTLISQWKPSTT